MFGTDVRDIDLQEAFDVKANEEAAHSWRGAVVAIVVIVLMVAGRLASGAEYYCDPVNGWGANPGTLEKPWPSLEATIAARLLYAVDMTKSKVKNGDTINLLTGVHGKVQIQNVHNLVIPDVPNSGAITIRGVDGHQAVITSLFLKGCTGFNFENLEFQNQPGAPPAAYLVQARPVDRLRFFGNRVQSAEDCTGWTADQWLKQGSHGLIFEGKDGFIANNSFRYLQTALSVGGTNLLCENNTIDYFVRDGINFWFDKSILRNNTVTNHSGIINDGFHYDGIQGWAFRNDTTGDTGIRYDCILENNVVIESTGKYPTIPMTATVPPYWMQGLCIFDGDWRRLKVRNNFVQCSLYHGMAFYGPIDSVIEWNVIQQGARYVDAKGNEIEPWLTIQPMKGNLRQASNVLVRNNISNLFLPDVGGGVKFLDNVQIIKQAKPWTLQPGNVQLGIPLRLSR